MIKLNYIENEKEHVFLCKTKMEALERIKFMFKDERIDKPIPYSLEVDGTLWLDYESLLDIEECFKFFKENPSYGQAFDQSIAKTYYEKEFNLNH